MAKLIVIFGGPVELYQINADFFNAFEKEFHKSLKRKSPFLFTCKIDSIHIDFRFAFHPNKDKAYEDSKIYFKKKWNIRIPPPVNDLIKEIKNPDVILFFGLCGAFWGKRNEIYVPTEYLIMNFKKSKIRPIDVRKTRPKKKIVYNNILNKLVKEKNGKIITTNITLNPRGIENKDEALLIRYCKILQKCAKLVDKESYMVIHAFKNIAPIGILVQTSDVILKHKFLEEKLSVNWNKFNQACLKVLKNIIPNIGYYATTYKAFNKNKIAEKKP